MKMDASELDRKMKHLGMERDARKLLIKENLASVDEVAIMTCIEVCSKILETYQVVSCEDEHITLVKSDDMDVYNSIVSVLSR